MGALMRTMDWSKTPIGPVESWSPTLRMMVRVLLVNRFQLFVWWGPTFCLQKSDLLHRDPAGIVEKSWMISRLRAAK